MISSVSLPGVDDVGEGTGRGEGASSERRDGEVEVTRETKWVMKVRAARMLPLRRYLSCIQPNRE